MDGQTDMTKLIIVFCNFPDAPKYTECCITMLHVKFTSPPAMQVMRSLPVLKEILFQIICNFHRSHMNSVLKKRIFVCSRLSFDV